MASLTIDGAQYEFPSLDSLTINEAQVMFEMAGMSVEDFLPPIDVEEQEQHREEVLERVRNPGFIRAMVHIAYARGNPRAKRSEIDDIVGGMNMLETIASMAPEGDEEGADAGPPVLTTEHEQPLRSVSVA